MLLAISGVAALGYTITAFDIIPHLLYQFILLVVVLIFIFFDKRAEEKVETD